MAPRQRDRLRLLQGALTYADRRLAGYDAAVLMEVVEHIDPGRLPAFEQAVLGSAAPGTVIITTPNADYNPHYPGAAPRRAAPPGPQVRVGPGRVPGLGGGGGAGARLLGAVRAGRCGGPAGRAAHADGGAAPRGASPGSPGHDGARGGAAAVTDLKIPELCLIVLVGVSGSGKSSFAARHFRPTEVLSSDTFRGLVGDDENDQSVTAAAFTALHAVAAERLKLGRLTVVDATNVQPDARRPLLDLARDQHVLPVAIVLDVPEQVCVQRNQARPDRAFGAGVVRRQHAALARSAGRLEREGFRRVFRLRGAAQVDAARIVREPAWADKSGLHGPFDIIGDVHGCQPELASLLDLLGYQPDQDGTRRHPAGRTAVFLGDLVDRGPDTPGVLRTVMGMVASGAALCVPGNHEAKLLRALRGRDVRRSHGLAESLAQLGAEPRGLLRRGRRVPRRPGEPLRAGLGAAGGRARRPARGDARARVGRGPGLRAVRRDHRGDRRVRPARPVPVGAGLPGQGGRGVRPHPGARSQPG